LDDHKFKDLCIVMDTNLVYTSKNIERYIVSR
jgi:hypothetical protein